MHYIKEINISQAYYHNTIRNDLTRLHGSGTMYNVFWQKSICQYSQSMTFQ